MTADDFFKVADSITNVYRAGMGLAPIVCRPVATQYEHLLRANYGSWCAHGHNWRTEKAAHERDIADEYWRAIGERERAEFERLHGRGQ